MAAALLISRVKARATKPPCPSVASIIGGLDAQEQKQSRVVGLSADHIHHLKEIANTQKVLIVVRARNADAMTFVGKSGYLPKPASIKLKSASGGPLAGLVVRPQGPRETWEPWERDEVQRLIHAGYRFDDLGILVSPNSMRFHADVDLQGIYKLHGKAYEIVDANEPRLAEVKAHLLPPSVANSVTHGPNDNFGAWDPIQRCWIMLRQPDPNEQYLLVTPTGGSELIDSPEKLKQEYQRLGIAWPYKPTHKPEEISKSK